MRKLLAAAFVLAVGGAVIQSLPDIRRYLRIKRM
ncbi:MAG: hypothetical protein ABR529_14360 [Actinomycetota bacterium]